MADAVVVRVTELAGVIRDTVTSTLSARGFTIAKLGPYPDTLAVGPGAESALNTRQVDGAIRELGNNVAQAIVCTAEADAYDVQVGESGPPSGVAVQPFLTSQQALIILRALQQQFAATNAVHAKAPTDELTDELKSLAEMTLWFEAALVDLPERKISPLHDADAEAALAEHPPDGSKRGLDPRDRSAS